MNGRPPRSPLFPYPPLFRSKEDDPLPRPEAKIALLGAQSPLGSVFKAVSALLEAVQQTGPTRRKPRSEEHTSELQSRQYLVCRLLLEKKKTQKYTTTI